MTPKRCGTSTAKPRAGATSTSPACHTRCSTPRGRSSGRCPPALSHGRARLYEDGRFVFDDGRARFAAVKPLPLAEPRDARYPFALTTGRLRDQWHGMSRTGTLGRLFGHASEPAIELHPRDLERLTLKAGDLLQVTSRRGSIVLPAQPSDAMAPMQAHIAMHWGAEVARRHQRERTCAGRRERADHRRVLPESASSPS